MNDNHSDDAIMERHTAAVRMLTEIIFRLVERFGPVGVTPMALMEASLKASSLAMAKHCGSKPSEIADFFEEAAAAVRAMPEDALLPDSAPGRAH
jgi:hypothetical protein